jgi:HSP20 family protein
MKQAIFAEIPFQTAWPLQCADEGFGAMAKQMSHWIDHILGPDYQHFRPEQTWRPAVNLYEDDTAFYMVADVGGVDLADVDLHVEKRQLMLRGHREAPRPPTTKECGRGKSRSPLRLHVMEIDHGPFSRALELPEDVDSEHIEACYRNGFIWVKMPKKK